MNSLPDSYSEIIKQIARDLRPVTISYKGLSRTFDMPGWYADGVEGGIHSGEDMKVFDRHLTQLKAAPASSA